MSTRQAKDRERGATHTGREKQASVKCAFILEGQNYAGVGRDGNSQAFRGERVRVSSLGEQTMREERIQIHSFHLRWPWTALHSC